MASTRERRAPDGPAPDDRVGVLLAILDFPMLKAAIRDVIEGQPDLRVAGEAGSRESLVADVEAARPDVVILECEGAGALGCGTYESIEAIHAACPEARIIALDCRCATEQFSVALRAGASGFLTRDAQHDDVLRAVRGVAAGHTYVSPAIVTRMVDTYVRGDPAVDDPYQSLSERERQILLLAAMGHTNRDIARSLHLSEQTVHNHRANVMEKLGLHDRVELLRYSIRRGLLNPSTL